jgi:hypothetical protein
MVFFLRRRIQPLQARVSKLWTYSGLNDPSRVSPKDPEKKYLDKRVSSLTTLAAKLAVPACLAVAFYSTHPLPQVRDLQPKEIFYSPSFSDYVLLKVCTRIVVGSPISGFTSSSSRGRPIAAEVAPTDSEAPNAFDNLDVDGAEGFLEESDSTLSPPQAESEVQGSDKKRK